MEYKPSGEIIGIKFFDSALEKPFAEIKTTFPVNEHPTRNIRRTIPIENAIIGMSCNY